MSCQLCKKTNTNKRKTKKNNHNKKTGREIPQSSHLCGTFAGHVIVIYYISQLLEGAEGKRQENIFPWPLPPLKPEFQAWNERHSTSQNEEPTCV